MRKGRRRFTLTDLGRRYEEEGWPKGQTVAEWEAENGLPHFSAYPEVAQAKTWADVGFFMYRSPTPEELEFINAQKSSKARAHPANTTAKRKRAQQGKMAKVSEDAVRAIRKARADGTKVSALAAEYQLTQAAIYSIVTHRTWKHVE